MPNHVHLILVPSDADGLRRALAPVHRRYAGIIHARRNEPAISGRAGSAPWRWTRRISPRRCATCRSTRCGPGWSTARRTGAGRARGRISPAGTTASPCSRPSASAIPISPNCLSDEADAEHDRTASPRREHRPAAGHRKFLAPLERKTAARSQAGQAGPRPRVEGGLSALSP